MRSSPVTRNESLMGFLLELVHSSTPPLVSGTVRSRPLAAKVNRRLLPLFRRPAMASRRFYATSLGCSRGGAARRAARRASLHVEHLPHHQAAFMPLGPAHCVISTLCQCRPPSGPSKGARLGAPSSLFVQHRQSRRGDSHVRETRTYLSPQEPPGEGPHHARRVEAYSLADGRTPAFPLVLAP